MTRLVAVSTPAAIALVVGAVVGLAFVAGLIATVIRRRAEAGPDIPPGMRPGPADELLERRHLERTMIWGLLFVGIMAIWIPALWLGEPGTNVADAEDLISRSEERGHLWFQVASEENPTGFGCARCHGERAEGGAVPFTTEQGEFIPAYPVPALNDVCGGAATGHPLIRSLEDIRDTIMQGREGTPMPSWSIRFAGPMNDHQIQDLIYYIVSIQELPEGVQNLCLQEVTEGVEPVPGPSPTGAETVEPGAPAEEEPTRRGESPTPEASPEQS